MDPESPVLVVFFIGPLTLVIIFWIIPVSVARTRQYLTGGRVEAVKAHITLPILRQIVQGCTTEDIPHFIYLQLIIPTFLAAVLGLILVLLAVHVPLFALMTIMWAVLFHALRKVIWKVTRKLTAWLFLSKEERAQIALGINMKERKK